MSATATPELKVAEDLSRMEGTYGKRVIGKLKTMNVLIIGMRGLGVETAKNLILAGPHSVVIHDDAPVVIADLGANFYLAPEHVGTGRAAATLPSLVAANPNVNVSLHTGEMTAEFLASFHVVVSTDNAPSEELVRRNNAVRTNGKFIYGCTNGVVTSVFVDFGDEHKVFDQDGIPEHSIVLEKIINVEGKGSFCEIDVEGAARHGFASGDVVKIEQVVGANAQPIVTDIVPQDGKATSYNSHFVINEHRVSYQQDGKTRTRPDHTKFDIADCSGAGAYVNGGVATLVKQEKAFHYTSLESQLATPTMSYYGDYVDFGRGELMHYVRLALFAFQTKHNGELPGLHNKADAQECVDEAKAILERHKEEKTCVYYGEFDDNFQSCVRNGALYARSELTAICAQYGGILAQEVVKFTGKYIPIQQWIHTGAMELLQPDVPIDATPLGCRYDDQISIIGKAAQTRIGKANLFLVGCGALGCEFIKGMAMSGYGCAGGTVHVTDMDTIELSNLSRQFLFRHKHVGMLKSEAASSVVVEMNPEFKNCLQTHTTKVAPDTEEKFTAQFWDSLDFVVNALDNVMAREYTDGRCVLHGLPLFESGTLGTQANSVVALPHVTKSYSEGAVAGENKGIAQCTLKNFPSLPLHCIEYAKEKFNDTFSGGAQKLKDFLENPEGWLTRNEAEGLGELESLKELARWLDVAAGATMATCVQIALDSYASRYIYGIQDLQSAYPEDSQEIDKTTGVVMGNFWRGHKRFPRAAETKVEDEAYVSYLYHTACIFGAIFGLPEPTVEQVREIAQGLTAHAYVPSAVSITDEKEEGGTAAADDEQGDAVEILKTQIRATDLKVFAGKTVSPTDFEKDDDTNHHIDWIASAAGLRAWNYYIEAPPKNECRMVAGNIIPAIATTTACITGFIQLEMLKYVIGCHLNKFRAVTFDLATNNYVIESLPDPEFNTSVEDEIICRPNKFTTWDNTILMHRDCSIQEFVAYLEGRLGVTCTQLYKPGEKQSLFMPCPVSDRTYKTAKKKLEKKDVDRSQRANYQATVTNYEEYKANFDIKASLKATFIRKYGPILGSNFVVLGGNFTDPETYLDVKVPRLKWVIVEDEESGKTEE